MILRRATCYLRLSVTFAVLSSVAFACIPICNAFGEDTEQAMIIVIASIFWGGLILEQVFFWMANFHRKKIQKRTTRKKLPTKRFAGALTFWSNVEARVCDVLLGVSLVSTFTLMILGVQDDWLVMTSLTLLLSSFNLHCLFNGRTYGYVKAFNQIKKEQRRK